MPFLGYILPVWLTPFRWVVNAAGAFAGHVGKMAGIEVPVKPFRRRVFITAPFEEIKGHVPLTIDIHRGWYFRKVKDNSAGERNWITIKLPERARGMDAPGQIKRLREGIL